MRIELNDVSYSYSKKGKDILDGISLECPDCSMNVLIGLNGCGKTTLIRTMAGLNRPKCGSISYGGNDFLSMRVGERSRIVSYVPQNCSAVSDYTVHDYLTFGTVNSLEFYELPKQEQLDRVQSIADRFNVSRFFDKRLDQLSGGERQIIMICAAMIQDTSVVLLDEPMSALDMKNQNMVLRLMKTIAEEDRKTVVLSTHNPNHALYLDGNVFLMRDGKVLDSGDAKDVITVDRLRPIYGEGICYSRDLGYQEISFC